MTEQEFLALFKEDPRKCDALVAEKVMEWYVLRGIEIEGWKDHLDEVYTGGWPIGSELPRMGHAWRVPCFTTEIAPAWQVVEKIHAADDSAYSLDWDPDTKEWLVFVFKPYAEGHAHHELLSMGIVIAALKLEGVIEQCDGPRLLDAMRKRLNEHPS